MPKYRSATTTHGRNMAVPATPWRATGMTDADFGKANYRRGEPSPSLCRATMHLRRSPVALVAEQIEASGGGEFNTIAGG